jgi:hypothetical protein
MDKIDYQKQESHAESAQNAQIPESPVLARRPLIVSSHGSHDQTASKQSGNGVGVSENSRNSNFNAFPRGFNPSGLKIPLGQPAIHNLVDLNTYHRPPSHSGFMYMPNNNVVSNFGLLFSTF